MDPNEIFMLPDGRLRAGWRLLLFVFFFLIAAKLLQAIAATFIREPAHIAFPILLIVTSGAALAAVCISTWVMMRLLEQGSFSAVGLRIQKGSLPEFGAGFLLGAGSIATVTCVEWGLGAIHFQASGAAAVSAFRLVLLTAGILALSAPNEELLFRGYGFQRIEEGAGGYVALVISSVIFGALHAANPHATKLSTANTMLAGVLLSIGYLKTRALWLSIGFHFSWNWTLALAGLPVSGLDIGHMPWQVLPGARPDWVYGGAYGPEGGVVASAVLIAGSVLLLSRRRKAPAPAFRPDELS